VNTQNISWYLFHSICSDLVWCYKIASGLTALKFDDFFSETLLHKRAVTISNCTKPTTGQQQLSFQSMLLMYGTNYPTDFRSLSSLYVVSIVWIWLSIIFHFILCFLCFLCFLVCLFIVGQWSVYSVPCCLWTDMTNMFTILSLEHTMIYGIRLETVEFKEMTVNGNVADKVKGFLHTAWRDSLLLFRQPPRFRSSHRKPHGQSIKYLMQTH